MSGYRHNALSPTQDSPAELSDHEFGLFFAAYVRALIEGNCPIDAPGHVTAYVRRFHEKVSTALGGANPTNRRRSLTSAADLFRAHRGWRAALPSQADACALALEALANGQKRSIGRPHGYVSRVFETWIEDALARDNVDEARAPFARGEGNRANPARRDIIITAIRLAEADGVPLTYSEAAKKARAYLKYRALPSRNYLAGRRKKQDGPAPKKIRAAGM
jgi:hypothetical protein